MSDTKNVVSQIRKATRRRFTAEEKIRIVLEALRGEIPISDICRRGTSISAVSPAASGLTRLSSSFSPLRVIFLIIPKLMELYCRRKQLQWQMAWKLPYLV